MKSREMGSFGQPEAVSSAALALHFTQSREDYDFHPNWYKHLLTNTYFGRSLAF